MNTLNTISNWFWSPYLWLPKGYDWKDLQSTEKVISPEWNDLWTYPFAMAGLAIFIRFQILNRFCYTPLAMYLGLKDVKHKSVPQNLYLENVFKKHKHLVPDNVLLLACKKLEWPQRKIERWLRKRAASAKISTQTKFVECAWQFTYYLCMFVYGLVIMIKKPWMYDINECWHNYPYHSLDRDVWWYYMISLSFYWSMIFTHFGETKRKDFWQMFFHHLVTIFLITFSWTCNFVRIGTIILVLHDCADIPLQAAKMCIYLGYKALCDAVFALFAVTWVITRDFIFPYWIVRNTLFEATNIIPIFPAYYIFNSLLVTLFVLHLYWTYFIFRIITNTIVKGKIEDDRSSSEIEISDSSNSSEKSDKNIDSITSRTSFPIDVSNGNVK